MTEAETTRTAKIHWTDDKLQFLRAFAGVSSSEEIGKALGVSAGAVRMKAWELKISLKMIRERRDLNGAEPKAEQIEGTGEHLGKPKYLTYDWKIEDQKPVEMAWVDKRLIMVDRQYQRNLDRDKVMDIARKWSWVAFGAVSLARRPNDELVVMEGQHRVAAAMRRADIETLPCVIFEISEVSREAKGFLDANTRRKPPNMFDKFDAILLDKSHEYHRAATALDAWAQAAGRKISSAKATNNISCIYAFFRCFAQNEEATKRVFAILDRACSTEGEPINQTLVFGMFYLETHLRGETLWSQHWFPKIEGRIKRMVAEIGRRQGIEGRGGVKLWAQAIASIINYKLQKENRLPVAWDDE